MANFNFNKVMIGGRLTGDPELKITANNVPVVSFSIAVNRKPKSKDAPREADFFNCTAWRATAEFISRYFRKGSAIFVVGSLQNRSWTDQQGVKRYATDIVCDEACFVESKSDAPPELPTAPMPEYASDADLPF